MWSWVLLPHCRAVGVHGGGQFLHCSVPSHWPRTGATAPTSATSLLLWSFHLLGFFPLVSFFSCIREKSPSGTADLCRRLLRHQPPPQGGGEGVKWRWSHVAPGPRWEAGMGLQERWGCTGGECGPRRGIHPTGRIPASIPTGESY